MQVSPHRPKPRFFDLAVPFFLPLWRRILAAVIPLLWALVELANGATFWALVFLGLGATAIWQFVIADWAAVAEQAQQDAERGG
ncbi:hypothetical protein [Yoonia sp.]|uniref:hypothetical protein n=1 Tax=Yoonia sp. TaxID=2212373 RepID=UPI003974B95B